MVFKQSKRPFSDDESCQLSYKHPRQLDFSSHLAPFVGICNDIPEKPRPSGYLNKSQGERLVNYTITELSVAGDKEIESSAIGSVTGLPWVTSSTSEEDPALQMSYSTSFFDHDHPPRALMESDEIYSSLFEYPPRKLVSVGPDHQADVPLWGLDGTNKSYSSGTVDGDNGEKFMGICIIPMPKADSSAPDGRKVGHGRTDCECLDEGSVRCVRQHVIEAREKLRLLLGKERFMELGFCDMGEDVGGQWSEEEEQVFHEVVFSNPASLGKNFWDHLSLAFPSKTKKDLVSYYFNVFMLRRRAEQNRSDPTNADSDNDEWQGSEDDSDNGEWQGSENDEFATSGDDENYPVDSLVDQGGICNNDTYEEDYNDDDDEDGDNSYDNNDDDGGIDDISESHVNQKPSSGKPFNSSHPIVQPMGDNNLENGSEDQDIQDESCTSYESQHNVVDSYGPAGVAVMQESRIETDDKHIHCEYRNDNLDGVVDQGYTLEPCDAKFWDVRFFTGPKKDVDFLPTCNVIQEVFGDEAWNNEPKNDLSIS